MKVTLRALGYIYDITKYVDLPIAQTKTLTGSFDTAQLTIPYVRANAIVGFDLSKKIPRMAIVEIEDIEETTQYYVTNPQIDKLNANEYRHILEMEELATILQLRGLPDYSVTQPLGEEVLFINEVSNVKTQSMAFGFAITQTKLNLSTASISPDTLILENRVMKVAGDFRFNVNLTVNTVQAGEILNDLSIIAKVDGVEVGRVNVGSINFYLTPKSYSVVIDYTNTAPEEVEIWLEANAGANTISTSVTASLEVVYQEAQTSEPIYLDYVVEKLLSMVNVIDMPEFVLDGTTKARLSNVMAFDDMQTDQTLYTAINRIANYVKAKPKVTLINGHKVLSFTYYSDLALQPYVEPNNEQMNALGQISDYVSGLEIKNENILSNSYKTETVTLRTDQINQITTENIVIRLSSPIDKIEHLTIKGIEMKDTNGIVVLTNITPIDIINRVVEKPHYDVLDNMAYYSNRTVRSKNNHIYFERGRNEIKGLAYIGAQYQASEFNENNHNRALYETIACELAKDYTMPTNVDKGLVYDNNIIIEVRYYPMNESNAVVLKDDQSGFEEKIQRKLNANDRVNNADILGAFVRSKVNSVGGTRIAKNGFALDGSDITKLGSMNDTYRVVTVTKYSFNDHVQFIETEVNEHIFESEYIGIDSDRRLYRVEKSEWVDRVDKALSIFELSKGSLVKQTNAFNEDYIVSVLANNYTPKPPLMAHLTFDAKELTIAVERNAIGNVIEWRVKALDNYNMEYEKVTTTFDSKDFIYQRGVEYSDLFGRADNLAITFYGLLGALFTKAHYDLYPRSHLPLTNDLGIFSYPIKKDARERFILSNQLALLSDSKDIIIYNGFAKYNRMTAEKDYTIKLARLDYEPSKDDIVIDLTKSVEVINDTLTNTSLNYFTFTANLSGHYAWYEEVTKELLIVVKNATQGINTIYYGLRINTFERGATNQLVKFYEAFNDTILIYASSTETKTTEYAISFNDIITLTEYSEDTAFMFPFVDYSDTITLTSIVAVTQVLNTVVNYSDTITLTSTVSQSITLAPKKTWVLVAQQTHNGSVTNVGSGSTCSTSSAIQTWLTANYPPNNYSLNYVMRVYRTMEDFALCNPTYYYYKIQMV